MSEGRPGTRHSEDSCGPAPSRTSMTSGYLCWGDIFINQAPGTPGSAKAPRARRCAEPVRTGTTLHRQPTAALELETTTISATLCPQATSPAATNQCKHMDLFFFLMARGTLRSSKLSVCIKQAVELHPATVMRSLITCAGQPSCHSLQRQPTKDKTPLSELNQLEFAS